MKQVVLVTGCAGFIASEVAARLMAAGHTVVGVDNLNDAYDVRMKHWRLRQLRQSEAFVFSQTNVSDRDAMTAAFADGLACAKRLTGAENANYAAIFHLAARAGVRYSVENPWIYCQTNILGTLNLLELAREAGVAKFVLASSSSVYGNTPATHRGVAFSEDFPTDFPCSPYAASKKAAEELAFSYHHLHGLDIAALRFFTVYGPAGRPDMSILRFVRGIAEGEPITLYGDGTQSRDFTYVTDIARGVISALKSTGYGVFNLGGDHPHTVNTLIETISREVGREPVIRRELPHPADVATTWADITRAETQLGWRPTVTLEEGIRRTVAWYMENREWVKTLEF